MCESRSHPEAEVATGIERWLIGHAVELAAAKIDSRALRAEAARASPALRRASRAIFAAWLAELET
jgi:GMP synthase (glutamine-hydrolysing)